MGLKLRVAASISIGGIAACGQIASGGPGGRGISVDSSSAPSVSLTAEDPIVLAAAGDIACDPDDIWLFNGGKGRPEGCRQMNTSDLVLAMDPDLVVTLGDIQYTDGAYSKYLRSYDPSWGRFKGITRPSVGGHDYQAGDGGYFTYFGAAAGDPAKAYYSYDVGNWHFVALNSVCEKVGGCWTDDPQGVWLQQDLAANQGKNILAYWHDPLFSSGLHGGDLYYRAFWDILRSYGAKIVLNGHDHVYERFAPQNSGGVADPEGIRQFVAGLGGYLIYGWSTVKPNSEARWNGSFGVLKLLLYPAAYEWEFVPEVGYTYSDKGRVDFGTGSTPSPAPSPTLTPTPAPTPTTSPAPTPAPTTTPTPTPAPTPTTSPTPTPKPTPRRGKKPR